MAAPGERLPPYSLLPRSDQISEDDDRDWAYLPQSQGILDSSEEYSSVEEVVAETCLICMEPAGIVTGPLMKLNCSCVDSRGHLHCLNTWFVREHTCPTCRNPLSASDRLRFGIDGVPMGVDQAIEGPAGNDWLEGVEGQEKVLIYYSQSFIGSKDDIGKCLFNLEAFCAGNYGLVIETVDEPSVLKIIFCSTGKELSGLMAESWLLDAEKNICADYSSSKKTKKSSSGTKKSKTTKKKKKSSSKCIIS